MAAFVWAYFFNKPYNSYVPRRLRWWYQFNKLSKTFRKHSRFKSLWFCTTLIAMTTTAQALRPHHMAPFDSDSYPIKVNNCCSKCITNNKDDFERPPRTVWYTTVKGLGGHRTAVTHTGTIIWHVEDDQGRVHRFRIPGSYYTKDANTRLLSPQHWAQTANDNYPVKRGTWCGTYDDGIELQWKQRKYTRTLKLDPVTNVATIYSAPGYKTANLVCNALVGGNHAYAHLIPADEDAQPISNYDNADTHSVHSDSTLPTSNVIVDEDEPPRELNTFQLAAPDNPHLVPDEDLLDDEEPNLPNDQALWTYWHNKLGHLPNLRIRAMARAGRLPRKLAECRIPLCPSCVFGKATRRPWKQKGQQTGLNKGHTITSPGDCVSIDQLESPTPGFIGQVKGPILTRKRYQVTTVFVDQYSDLTYLHHQLTTSGDDTLEAKTAFETYAASHGVTIRHYHADNGRFAENKFLAAAQSKGQTVSFCGVGAHFQNGVAEKRIRDLQDSARTMLIHATRRWPSAISVHLWPYALTLAKDIRNATSKRDEGTTPLGIWSTTKQTPRLKDFHTFACPVYVLDKRMQSANKINKWEERTRVGIYLGQSPSHAQTVHLVLSLITGHVSAQFHIKCDDRFETVRRGSATPLPSSQWQALAHFTNTKGPVSTRNEGAPKADLPTYLPTSQRQTTMSTTTPTTTATTVPMSTSTSTTPAPTPPASTPVTASEGATTSNSSTTSATAEASSSSRRSARAPKPTQRMLESINQRNLAFEAQFFLNVQDELEIDTAHPIAYAASSDPDTMHLHQALREPDANEFRKAMKKEIDNHERRQHWVLVLRANIPPGTKVLKAVWSMRRKRRIDTQEVYKHKGRLTIHGGMQVYGVNYWETYSPVVRWSTIRVILTISIMNGWHTRQLDFVLAYPQAPVECDLYMENTLWLQHQRPQEVRPPTQEEFIRAETGGSGMEQVPYDSSFEGWLCTKRGGRMHVLF